MNHTIHNVYDSLFYKHNLKIVFSVSYSSLSSLFQGAGYCFVKYGSTIFHLAIFFSLVSTLIFFNFVIYSMYSSILIDITRLDIRSGFADWWRRPFIMLDLSIYSQQQTECMSVSNTCQECYFQFLRICQLVTFYLQCFIYEWDWTFKTVLYFFCIFSSVTLFFSLIKFF